MKKLLVLLALAIAAVFTGCRKNNFSISNLTSTGTYPDSGKYTAGEFTYSASDVKEVALDWISGSVNIVKSEESTLRVYETDTGLTEDQKLHWYLEGDLLRIKFCKSGYTGIFPPNTKDLTLEIPDGIKLEASTVSAPVKMGSHSLIKAELSSTSGDYDIGSINAEKIEIVTVSGNVGLSSAVLSETAKFGSTSGKIELGTVAAEELKVSSTSGGISVRSADIKTHIGFSSTSSKLSLDSASCESLKFSTISGNITLGLSKCANAKLDTTSGNCTLSLPESGAVIDFSSSSGDFICDKAVKNANKNYVVGNGECEIKFNSTSGNLTVN